MTEDEFNQLTVSFREKEQIVIAVFEDDDSILSFADARGSFAARSLLYSAVRAFRERAELNNDSKFVDLCNEIISLIDIEADYHEPIEGSMKQ